MDGVLKRAALPLASLPLVKSLAKRVSWKMYSGLLERQGRHLEAVDYLQELASRSENFDIEHELVQLRGEAGVALVENSRSVPAPCVTAADAVEGFPLSIAPRELSPAAIRKGIASNGCIHVPGFFDAAQTTQLQAAVRQSLEALADAEQERLTRAGPWYEYYVPKVTPASAALKDRFSNRFGSLRVCDTPRGMATWLHVAKESGLLQVIEGYLASRPILTTFKTTFREATPGPEHKVWHQDGAFMGPVRTLNVWVALTKCGRDAPGLEFIPERMDILKTGTDDAVFDWSVAPSVVSDNFADRVICPEYEAGDMLLFDERLLHRTYITPEMTSPRHAIESWFFHPAAYPEEFAVFAV